LKRRPPRRIWRGGGVMPRPWQTRFPQWNGNLAPLIRTEQQRGPRQRPKLTGPPIPEQRGTEGGGGPPPGAFLGPSSSPTGGRSLDTMVPFSGGLAFELAVGKLNGLGVILRLAHHGLRARRSSQFEVTAIDRKEVAVARRTARGPVCLRF